ACVDRLDQARAESRLSGGDRQRRRLCVADVDVAFDVECRARPLAVTQIAPAQAPSDSRRVARAARGARELELPLGLWQQDIECGRLEAPARIYGVGDAGIQIERRAAELQVQIFDSPAPAAPFDVAQSSQAFAVDRSAHVRESDVEVSPLVEAAAG